MTCLVLFSLKKKERMLSTANLLGNLKPVIFCKNRQKTDIFYSRTVYVLVIPWFVRMYDAIMHERERVHYRTYMRRTMV